MLSDLQNNRILWTVIIAWAVAQAIKAVLYTVINRKFSFGRVFGAGGMPSSHSASVCALTFASAMQCGMGSYEFAFSFILAAIVMHDAMGVRNEAGKHAKILNILMDEADDEELNCSRELKEFIGHTPTQVAVGAAIGVLTAIISYAII